MTDTAIRVENLSKRYRIGTKEQVHETLTSALMDFAKRPLRNLRDLRRLSRFDAHDASASDVIWALKDVSFEVKTGEVVGIIGRNGAGKSTLLKILSRITRPTHGRVVLNGRVASLLEVGTGFHPDLSGRENIYLNGTILGMTKAEIDRKFDEIVDFSGVEKFIDTPVKRYSSGMYVRLAFAVAAHLEPEILLVDEVLAVGDAEFQKKCLGKMGDIAHDGRTVIFVSHNLGAVSALCNSGIFLSNGSVRCMGSSRDIVAFYQDREVAPNRGLPLNLRADRTGDGSIRTIAVNVCDADGHAVITPRSRVSVILDYAGYGPLIEPTFQIGIYDTNGTCVYHFDSRASALLTRGIPTKGRVVCTMTESLRLTPRQYVVNIGILNGGLSGEWADHVEGAHTFDVAPAAINDTGHALPSHVLFSGKTEWTVSEQ